MMVQEMCKAQEEAMKFILANIESEQQEQAESINELPGILLCCTQPHWLRTWKAGNQVMLQAYCKGKAQPKKLSKVRAQQPWMVLRLVGGGGSGGFPILVQSPHSGNSSQR